MLAWQPWEEQWPESVQPCHVNPRVLSQSCNDGDITGRINVAQATMVATCKLPTINAEDPCLIILSTIHIENRKKEKVYENQCNCSVCMSKQTIALQRRFTDVIKHTKSAKTSAVILKLKT